MAPVDLKGLVQVMAPTHRLLGNSKVEAEMFEDEEGVRGAILRRKKTNGL